MTREALHTGGCQCGAVRYAVYAEPGPGSICHCRMCQKAFGGYFGPLTSVSHGDYEWTRGTPEEFRSSDAVTRGFCRDCGTPLTFAYDKGESLDFAIGSFDDPARIKVTSQLWYSSRIPSFDTLHELPKRPEDEPGYEGVVEKVQASNHQHPDHDTADWPHRK